MTSQPPAYDMPALLAAHPCRLDGAEMRKQFDERGLQYGPAFAGLAAVHSADETVGTVLAEVSAARPDPLATGRLRRASRACSMPVSSRLRLTPTPRSQVALVCCCRCAYAGSAAYASARTAHYCYTRVTSADGAGLEADLDVLDEHGTVLLAVQRTATRHRGLRERQTAIAC